MKTNNFRGDLTNISAKKGALHRTSSQLWLENSHLLSAYRRLPIAWTRNLDTHSCLPRGNFCSLIEPAIFISKLNDMFLGCFNPINIILYNKNKHFLGWTYRAIAFHKTTAAHFNASEKAPEKTSHIPTGQRRPLQKFQHDLSISTLLVTTSY